MKYEDIPELSKKGIESAVQCGSPDQLAVAVLSAALFSEDRDWAEDVCARVAMHSHFNVRGNAILGLGHIARVQRRFSAAR